MFVLRSTMIVTMALSMANPAQAQSAQATRPVSTYSIVARDPATGEIGVAVQSHWFSVGPIVPWVEAGVGAVATQSFAEPAYGPLGLHLMRLGTAAPDALRGLVEADDGRAMRQVAMIDSQGRVAAYSGERCISEVCQLVDENGQFSVQANLMARDTVCRAMAEAFRNAKGDLAERMLAALDAAEAEGGDIRGRQSAALQVARAESSGKPWEDLRFDLRVEDHSAPLVELRRLVTIRRAYQHLNAGEAAFAAGDFVAVAREYDAAERLAPEIVEIPFWRAVSLVRFGRLEEALPVFRRVFEREPVWAELPSRLMKAGWLPDDGELLSRILAERR